MRKCFFVLPVGLILLGLVSGCGDGGGGISPDERARELTNRGWNYYQEGDMTLAKASFREALDAWPGYVEARCGLGYSLAGMDSLSPALTALREVVSVSPHYVDAHAGAAFCAQGLDSTSLALEHAQEVIDLTPGLHYVFDHNENINEDAVRFLMCEVRFSLGEYEQAYEHLLAIDPSLDLDSASSTFPLELLESMQQIRGELGTVYPPVPAT